MFNFFITGCNSGLAKEMARQLGVNDNLFVIARNNDLGYSETCFRTLDLSDIDMVESFAFNLTNNKMLNILINNAAILGDINYFHNIAAKDIKEVVNVNYLSPTILANKFLKQNLLVNNRALVVNIVSGVSIKKLPYLSIYTISKMAQANNTIVIDLDIKQNKLKDISIIGIDPGMIRTKMQEKLRDTEFGPMKIFKERYKKNEINPVDMVASKILNFVKANEWQSGINYEFKDL